MRQINVHAAKTHLSQLIEAALNGEDIVIARGNKPAVRLVPVVEGGFKLGLLRGRIGGGPDFLAPLERDELALWEGEAEPGDQSRSGRSAK